MGETIMYLRTVRDGETFGQLAFALPERFHVERRATGFTLELPATVALEYKPPRLGHELRPMLSDLRLSLRLADSWGSGTEFGVATAQGAFIAPLEKGADKVWFHWRGTPAEMAFYEKARAGRPPRIKFVLTAELTTLCMQSPPSRGRPERVSGEFVMEYSAEVWTQMLRDSTLGANVLVETPLPTSPDHSDWREIWKALADAQDSFGRGGETAWTNAIVAVRKALEKWRDLERPDLGPGWPEVNGNELKARTKAQRLDAIRFALHQFAHLSAHENAEHFDREDAVVALVGLAALLAERRA